MMIYQHFCNLTQQQSDRIKQSTTRLGWNQTPLNKNKMTEQGTTQSWEITKNKDNQFYHLFLDKHILVYRVHGDNTDDKFHRMMQWENEIRIRELQDEPIDDILSKIEEVSHEERDRVYLGNKLLRETNQHSRKEKVKSYLENLSY